MTLIVVLLFSALGFSGFLALDIPALQRHRWGLSGLILLAVLSLITAFVLATREGIPLGIPSIWRWIGIPMMILGIGMMVYSTLIEIPLASLRSPPLYIKDVYQKGTYALCRHPGFLWMLIYLIGFVLVYNLVSAAELAIYWMALELMVIIVQDQVIFPRQFPSYRTYQLTTPFILPTLASLRTFLFQYKGDS
jgi:steroid 5-alpha reductase family enzyme